MSHGAAAGCVLAHSLRRMEKTSLSVRHRHSMREIPRSGNAHSMSSWTDRVMRPCPTASGSSQQPISQIPPDGIERHEHDAADDFVTGPETIDARSVVRRGCCVALERGPRAIDGIGDECRSHPRPDVVSCPAHMLGECVGVPGLEWLENVSVSHGFFKHVFSEGSAGRDTRLSRTIHSILSTT